ncbi:hypothetical protein H9P43_002612 [Blastocladiella emersonii ATCC 22665]|nr:hypothetical protein H9P43_002612 [Blastocladiella emersonii ATCC 22665]
MERDVERVVTFIAFLAVALINVSVDTLFASVVTNTIRNARRGSDVSRFMGLEKWRFRYLAYLPAMIAYLGYGGALVAAIALNSATGLNFSTITLCRFSATVALSTFVLYSVPRTKSLIAASRSQAASTAYQSANTESLTAPNSVIGSTASKATRGSGGGGGGGGGPTFDPNNYVDRLTALGIALHIAGELALFASMAVCVRHLHGRRTPFWWFTFAACVILVPSSALEIGYSLSKMSNGTLWTWNSFLSLAGDLTVRVGFAMMSVLRFYRVALVRGPTDVHAKKQLYAASTVVSLVLCVSAVLVTQVRVLENQYVKERAAGKPPPDLVDARNTERYVTFATFLFISACNVATDILFVRVILGSIRRTKLSASQGGLGTRTDLSSGSATLAIRKLRKHWRSSLPYLPSLLTYVAYAVTLIVTVVSPDTGNTYLTITLCRFSANVMAATFVLHSIPQTKRLVKRARGGSTGVVNGSNNPRGSSHQLGTTQAAGAAASGSETFISASSQLSLSGGPEQPSRTGLTPGSRHGSSYQLGSLPTTATSASASNALLIPSQSTAVAPEKPRGSVAADAN